jgi:hypothetical protein
MSGAAEQPESQLEVQLAPLIIEQPWATLRSVLTNRFSKVYDGYVSSGASPPNRIVREDVSVINRSMGTRSGYAQWEPLFRKRSFPALLQLDPAWDLLLISDVAWAKAQVLDRVKLATNEIARAGIGVAAVTKLLHIKRPALMPVCDTDVLGRLGVTEREVADQVERVCIDLRREGRRLLPELTELQGLAAGDLHVHVSLVRILEVLIWRSHPHRGGYRAT